MEYKRGQVWLADLSSAVGCEQGGIRPVLIISNNIGNSKSPVVIVAPITTKIGKKRLPTQVFVEKGYGLAYDSMIQCEQIKTIDKQRLSYLLAEIKPIWLLNAIDKAIKISLGV